MIMFEIGSVTIKLPRRLTNTGNHAFICKLTEADTAHTEIAHESVATTTAKTAIDRSRREFRRLFGTRDSTGFCHIYEYPEEYHTLLSLVLNVRTKEGDVD